jgi:stage IV sporulation protein FB
MKDRITVRFEPSFWLLVVVYGCSMGRGSPLLSAIWGLGVGISILWHELGHAAANLAFGRPVDIRLHAFGGSTRARVPGNLKTWQTFVVAAAGCAAGFALAGGAAAAHYLLLPFPEAGARAALPIAVLVWVNVVFGLLNLMPVQPLDGGHLLRTVLQGRFGLKGVRAAHSIGMAFAALGAACGAWLRSPYMALFAAALALGEYRNFRRALRTVPQDEDPALYAEYKAARALWDSGRKDEAVAAFIALRKKVPSGAIHDAATGQLALCLYLQGQHGAAYPLMKSLPPEELSLYSRVVLQVLAHHAGRFEEAIRLGQNNFHEKPDATVAARVATSYAAVGDAEAAVHWLKAAARFGMTGFEEATRGPEFDKVREAPAFKEYARDRGGLFGSDPR